MDAERTGAHALLHILARSRVSVDVMERGQLGHDGRHHGGRQFSGSRTIVASPFSPGSISNLRLCSNIRLLPGTRLNDDL